MTLRTAKESEFENICRLFRRASSSIEMEYGKNALDKTIDQEYQLNSIKEGRMKILLEKGRILAYAIINHSISSFFFPESRSSEKETDLLIQTKPNKEEEHVIIEQIMVDPFYQRKGIGKSLFFSIADQYRNGLVITALIKENKGALAFVRALGCLARGYIELEDHDPKRLVLISYRLHERTATYRAHNNIHAS